MGRRPYRQRRDPWRYVNHARIRAGTTGLIRGTKSYWWELTLDCTHVVERRARYRRALGRIVAATAPKRVRCEDCGAKGKTS